MRNTAFTRGWSAVGLLGVSTLLTPAGAVCTATCPGQEQTLGGLKPAEVGRALPGEWEGQIQVHSSDGKLSTAPASMSARMGADRQSVELYYEGFAFGKPVEGAMVFSFDSDNTQARLRDRAVQLDATCKPGSQEPADNAYQLSCSSKSLGQFRILFTRVDQRTWDIAYQSCSDEGEWSDLLVLQLDRLGVGQRSAAADAFDHSPLLLDLRSDSAVASVDGDD